MFDAPRRKRRRRLLLPIGLTVVAAIALVVATAGGDARTTISYLEDVQNTALELSRSASTMSNLMTDLSTVDRAEFESVVDGLERSLDAAQEVSEVDPPAPEVIGAATLFRLALDSWAQGVDNLAEGLLRAADDQSDVTAVDQVSSGIALIRAGDQIYQTLNQEFSRDEVPAPVSQMPDITLMANDTPLSVLAPAWVTAVRSETSGVAIRASIRIEQVRTDPEWVTNAEDTLVVPLTSDMLEVIVVVGNSGNTPTEPATLMMTITSDGTEPVEASQEVPPINAGANTSVIFTDIAAVAGASYQLQLNLVPGGADAFAEDNQYSTGFVVNPATPSTDTTTGG